MMTANHSFKSVIINSNMNSVCAINYMVMASASHSSNALVHGHFGLNGLDFIGLYSVAVDSD